MGKITGKNNARMVKTKSEVLQTRKRSARLETKKSTSLETGKKSIAHKNETENHKSADIRRVDKLRRRNESQENDSDDKKAEFDDPRESNSKNVQKKTQNKFFKSKSRAFDDPGTILNSQKPTTVEENVKSSDTDIQIKRKEESSGNIAANVVPLRQTTLSESFNRAVQLRRLRPRNNIKENKINEKLEPKKKEPVYKTVNKLREENTITEDRDSVYDFEFDLNDPEEKPIKNRNKGKKKRTRKKTVDKKTLKTDPLVKNKNNETLKDDGIDSRTNPKPSIDAKISSNDRELELISSEIKTAEGNRSERLQEPEEESVLHENSRNVDENVPRVRIRGVETLRGSKRVNFRTDVSLSRQDRAEFDPITNGNKEMMEHSLLNKSWSPIKRQFEKFDPASPWRPPLIAPFSSVKQVVQSTPQQAKRQIPRFRNKLGFEIDGKSKNVENFGGEIEMKRNANPLRTRISNEENIQVVGSKINESEAEENSSSPSKFAIVKKKAFGISSSHAENKENSRFGDRLWKSPKKNEKSINCDGFSGSKNRNDPPNPSENLIPNVGQTLMKQSNLNGFLKLDEMPESISINTSHGIFGDGISSPVLINENFKERENTQDGESGIEDFFGFEEDRLTDKVQVNNSPKIKFVTKFHKNIKNKSFDRLKRRDLFYKTGKERAAARISLGEIKNTLYPRKGEERTLDKMLDRVDERNKKKEIKDTEKELDKKKNIIDPVEFSDTFDVLSENGQSEANEKTIGNDIKLFTDLEPVHFTQPPRWSYAKKRERKHDWSSDDEDDNDDDDDVEKGEEPVLKKRKLTKFDKIEERNIDEWVKSVNETFQEIDEFDLVVEKLP